MSELLASVRADLTDRRLLPAVALVCVCVVAALAYAALGGSGSSEPPVPAPSAPVRLPGIAVTAATPEHAVAETTDGFKEQTSGNAHDPFATLAGATSATGAAPAASAATASATSATSAASTTGTSTGSSGSQAPEGASSPSSSGGTSTGSGKPGTSGGGAPKKKKTTVYDVAIEFGTLPPETTPESAQLTPFTKLKLETPLPSAQLPLLVFRGVTAKGKSATFTLVGEAILSGTGACLPSSTQCEAVDLKPGETEQLSYLAADGQSTVYELRVLTITAEQLDPSSAKAGWAESKAGRELLRSSGLEKLPFLHYSSQPGVLVFAPHKATVARARIAVIAAAR